MSALTDLIGKELGPTEWFEVTQERIDQFAEATDDPQWIHTDPVRGYSMGVNYGVNKVRFPAPVPSGSRIRARFAVQTVEEVTGGEQAVVLGTVEREGGEKPVCVAELVVRMYR
jgi:acyl dehydratase